MRGLTFISQKETISTVSVKGQVTLPVQIRRHLHIGPNDKVAFTIRPTGDVAVTSLAYPTVQSLRGAAGSLKEPLAWKEVKKRAHEDRLQTKYGK